jgi:translation initiation factor 2 beta subunit (eIF-2beta)/eIF-5
MDACPNCGSYDSEQEGGRAEGVMTLTCTKCGDRRWLESYRQEGEDRWRDQHDREDRW